MVNDRFMTYAPAPPDSTDDSDIHADSEDVVDTSTPTIQEEQIEQQVEEETEQAASPAWVEKEQQINHVKETWAVTKLKPEKRRCCTVWTVAKVMVWSVTLALVMVAAVLIVLYETDHIATLNPLRHNHSVKEFKEVYYIPVRTWMEEGWDQLSQRYQQLPSMDEWMKQFGINKGKDMKYQEQGTGN